jgi:hypothetical protein
VEGDDLRRLVGAQDRDVVAAQAARGPAAAPAQGDEIAVEPQDPLVRPGLRPVERDGIVEPAILEQLLPLEQHRDAG